MSAPQQYSLYPFSYPLARRWRRALYLICYALLCVLAQSVFPRPAHAESGVEEGSALVLGRQQQLESQVLGEQRAVNIWLPPSYGRAAEQSYPVLYVLDGGMDEDFIHIVGLVSFLTTYQQMPETIVVGLVNVDRKRDFTSPSENAQDRADIPQHGGAQRFIQFLGSELIPWVEQHYRTQPQRTLLGQSLGGLLATQILLEQPQLFEQYLIVSPSLWWNDSKLFAGAAEQLAAHPVAGRHVFFAVGNEHPAIVQPTQALQQQLSQQTWPGLRSSYRFLAEEDHATALHLAAYSGFIWFYKLPLDAVEN